MWNIPDGTKVRASVPWNDAVLHGRVVGRARDHGAIDAYWYAIDFGGNVELAKTALGARVTPQDFGGRLPALTGFAMPVDWVEPLSPLPTPCPQLVESVVQEVISTRRDADILSREIPPLRRLEPSPPARAARSLGDARAVLSAGGRWIEDFGIDVKGEEPPEFRHFFLAIQGDARLGKGAIVTGVEWDRTNCPRWQVVHGWTSETGRGFEFCSRLAYLGSSWEPRFAALHDEVFASGGDKLERFVAHSGLGTGSKPVTRSARASDARGLMAAGGRWVRDLGIDVKGSEPPEFRHFFLAIQGDSRMGKGAVVTGEEWDHTDCPRWRVVHGWLKGTGKSYEFCSKLAYLGSSWEPRFTALHDEVFASGGDKLERFEAYSGSGSGSRPSFRSAPTDEARSSKAVGGRWIGDFGIRIAADEPPQFRHYFIAVEGNDYIGKGAIVTGDKWDKSESPKWRVVHGWTKGDGCWFRSVDCLAYLGVSWEPRFLGLHDALFADGGARLARFEAFSGPAAGSGPPARTPPARTPPARTPPAADARSLVASAGRWIKDFDIDTKGVEPTEFRHFFLAVEGDSRMGKGAIVTGEMWDRSNCPRWRVVHGWSWEKGQSFEFCSKLAYLGSSWEPRFISLHDAVFADGGTRLERFLTHSDSTTVAAPSRAVPLHATSRPTLTAPTSREASAVISAGGSWITDFHVDPGGSEPAQFRHYFIAVVGDRYIAKGAIITGEDWRPGSTPMWRVLHGWTRTDGRWFENLDKVTYLGPSWEPRFIALHDAVFASGGTELERFEVWSGRRG
jgi:hypothetical protein